MTIAPSKLLTYEDYLAEDDDNRRYDILDGVRYYMGPTRQHQEILLNVAENFRFFQKKFRQGRTIISPCDILISYAPLRTRQPDVFFISCEQLAKNGQATDPTPLFVAPELVVEILSPSDTKRVLHDKLDDYAKVGVREAWIIDQDLQNIEVLRFTPDGIETAAIYGSDETAISLTFPDLSVAVADIFAT
ncbi:MAG: Uma2 family endonuclease [Chthonomonadaceae bacterium]|nr:Uma2 family endonuclease [Chthonomonadaceae bacterium]